MSASRDAADYRSRANLHRPADPVLVAAAITQLNVLGLTPHDIAAALGLHAKTVREVLSHWQKAVP
jgi:DNA-binding NarL/FixJ family response regulator